MTNQSTSKSFFNLSSRFSRNSLAIGLAGLFMFSAVVSEAVPTSDYFLTAGDQVRLTKITGNTFTQFSLQANTEYPMAVNGEIVTTGHRSNKPPGGTYTLGGVFLAPAGTLGVGGNFWDGTTDGSFNYAFNWTSGGVYQFNTDWSGGSLLFALGGSEQYLGITYDPTDDTFWVSGWDNSNVIGHYSRTGSFIGSFNANTQGERGDCHNGA